MAYGSGGCRGSPGNAPAYAGTDFLIAWNGRIAAVYLFFDGPGDAAASNGPPN